MAYPNHSFMMCGGPEAFTSNIMFEKCGGKQAQEGSDATL